MLPQLSKPIQKKTREPLTEKTAEPAATEKPEKKDRSASSNSKKVATAHLRKRDHDDEESSGKEEEAKDEDEGSNGAREGWFYEQRSYPLTEIPRMARVNAIEHVEREQKRLQGLKAVTRAKSDTTTTPLAFPAWVALGPQPIGQGQTFGSPRVPVSGRVSAIALDPGYNGTSNQTVYVGGAQGGVWRSTDNGTTWTPIMDDQPSLAIGAIAIDPTNPNTIYVGTGEPNFSGDSYYGAGLLKTTNGGATWTQIKGPQSPNDPTIFAFMNVVFPRIVIDPTSPSTIYAVTNANGHTSGASGGSGSQNIDQRGIWKSTDGGVNWTNLDPLGNGGVNSGTDVLIDPRKPSKIYAAIQAQGLFLFDGTLANPTWQKLTASPLPSTGFTRIVLASGHPISPATETTVYAALCGNG